MRTHRRRYSAIASGLGLFVLLAGAARADERDAECGICHFGVGDEAAPKLGARAYGASIHREVGCVGCHEDLVGSAVLHERPDEDLGPVDCARCHEEVGHGFVGSLHAGAEVGCVDCHGAHGVRAVKDPESSAHPANQLITCGRCHTQQRGASAHTVGVLTLGRATDDGVVALVGPPRPDSPAVVGCTDCHAAHALGPTDAPESSLSDARIADTCGRCHQDAREAMGLGAHAAAVAGRTQPTCTSCHRLHGDGGPRALEADCGTCHADERRTHVAGRHGRDEATRCWDCHEAHGVLAKADRASPTHPANKAATCQRCHEGADEAIASFSPHADPGDPGAWAGLYAVQAAGGGLLLALAVFTLLHALLWVLRRAGEGRAPIEVSRPVRGRIAWSLEIAWWVALFGSMWSGLAIAGRSFGALAGTLHRGFAGGIVALLLVELGLGLWQLQRRAYRGKAEGLVLGAGSALPTGLDLESLREHSRWLLGVGPRPSAGTAYWSKLEFWAATLVALALIATGVLRLWPGLAGVLAPGFALQLATIVHSPWTAAGLAVLLLLRGFGAWARRFVATPRGGTLRVGRRMWHRAGDEKVGRPLRTLARDRL